MMRLDGETVIVTGASRGLGASMSERFAREGGDVTLIARNEADLRAVADRAADAPGRTLVAPADVTDANAIAAAVDATIDRFGPPTGLVNNAAVGMLSLYNEQRDLLDVSVSDFRRIIAVNLTGAFVCITHAVPHMVEAGRGNVINVSSGLGRYASPGWGPYVASKWGLEGLTRSLADELAEAGVNVNALDPGGRAETGFWDHLPADERGEILDPDVMDEAATLLLAQDPGGVTRESMAAVEWEERLD